MPNCYQLYRKGETRGGITPTYPATLQSVDEAICQHFGVPVHPKYWFRDWHNIIGFKIAMGSALGSSELRQWITENADDLLDVLAFLETNYTSDAWAEIGRSGRKL
jgi:hypothetical protein